MTQHAFLENLDRYFDRGTESLPMEATARMLAGAEDDIRDYLATIAASRSRIDSVANNSYWHTNGFAKMVLHESVNGTYRVRLHAWLEPGAVSERMPNVHNHRWDFASVVIVGLGMGIREFSIARAGTQYHAFEYARGETGASIEPIGTAWLMQTSERTIEKGMSYVCRTADLHVTSPLPGARTFTMIVQGRARLRAATIYSLTKCPSQTSEADGALTRSEVRDMLTMAVDRSADLQRLAATGKGKP
jgi:hypothetical protein